MTDYGRREADRDNASRLRILRQRRLREREASDDTGWRLIMSYRRDVDGNMTDFWSDDPWATARVKENA